MEMTLTEAITFTIAVLGAVLGIINTWRNIDKDRIKIRVHLIWSFFHLPATGTQERFGIEITNLSSIPITVFKVGFLPVRVKDKQLVFLPECTDGKDFSRRMESRISLSVTMAPGSENDPMFAHVTRAFVTTACGKRFTGTSPALKGLIEEHRQGKRRK